MLTSGTQKNKRALISNLLLKMLKSYKMTILYQSYFINFFTIFSQFKMKYN